MNALAVIRETPGLNAYLDAVEERLEETIALHPGVVSEAAGGAVAGGKRLRPLLVFVSAPQGRRPTVEAGVAVELVHIATLVHDDLVDGAELRHGRSSVWSVHGQSVAVATGDYLFSRAFSELAATGDVEAVGVLARTAVALARGEALQRRQANDPDTTIESYVERCALKTGKLLEAACRLAYGPADFGLTLGIAYQIADDILDCTGDAAHTGKLPGTDLREGTPTLPLILAAREDELVRRALAGEAPTDGVLLRVGATGALERSRQIALTYARQARRCLGDGSRRPELEALTHIVIDRER